MTQKLFERAAYHESGHIVMAYLVRYTSDDVKLIIEDPGSGRTKFNYGNQTTVITSILNFNQYPEIYNGLSTNDKSVSDQIAFKITGTLLGGPVTEALYLSGVDFVGNLPIEMSGPDLISVLNIDSFLGATVPGHPKDYVQQNLKNVTALMRQDEVWKAVEQLAQAILSSPDKQLSKKEIEDSLQTSGYLDFIK